MSKAPWFTDLCKQGKVVDNIAGKETDANKRIDRIRETQDKMWSKYDRYMLRRSVID